MHLPPAFLHHHDGGAKREEIICIQGFDTINLSILQLEIEHIAQLEISPCVDVDDIRSINATSSAFAFKDSRRFRCFRPWYKKKGSWGCTHSHAKKPFPLAGFEVHHIPFNLGFELHFLPNLQFEHHFLSNVEFDQCSIPLEDTKRILAIRALKDA